MGRRFVPLLAAVLLSASCGPRYHGDFIYVARRGDTLAALNERLGGDDRLLKDISRRAAVAAEVPLDAGARVAVPFATLARYRPGRDALELAGAARADRAAGDLAAAAAAMERARALLPQDAALAFELGDIYLDAGDYGRARANLAAAGALAPADEEITLALAAAAAEDGDVAAAAERLAALAERRPELAFTYYALGELLTRAGEYAAGRHHFFTYLKMEREGPVAAAARRGVEATARLELAARRLEEEGAGERANGAAAEPPREAGPTK